MVCIIQWQSIDLVADSIFTQSDPSSSSSAPKDTEPKRNKRGGVELKQILVMLLLFRL